MRPWWVRPLFVGRGGSARGRPPSGVDGGFPRPPRHPGRRTLAGPSNPRFSSAGAPAAGPAGRLTAGLPPKGAGWATQYTCALLGSKEGNDVRVLVVEDEQLLADAVATGLRREAMA